MARIGVQGMMLKERFVADGVFETLRKVSDLGYHSIEMSQVSMAPENVAEMARARAELGMQFAALSAALETFPGHPGESLTDNFDKIVNDAHQLGSSILRIGMLPFAAMADKAQLLRFVDITAGFARRLKAEGLNLVYHNHHVEFSKFDGVRLIDIIRDAAPDLRYEVDVHWVHRSGVDPVAYLEECRGTVDLIHLKDYRVGALPASALELLKQGDMQGFMNAFTGIIQFAEVGEGNLNFNAIIDKALETGVEHLLVEQDDLYGRDPFDCLRTSRDNLQTLGYAHLF